MTRGDAEHPLRINLRPDLRRGGSMKFFIGILLAASVASASDVSPARIREAAAKALTIIQKSQKNWYAKESCFSCHQQALPALAFQYAREHGIPVDEKA